MPRAQCGKIETGNSAVDDAPLPRDHDAIGLGRAANQQGGERIAGARETQIVEREESEIGLESRGDAAEIVAAEAARRSRGRPADRIMMARGADPADDALQDTLLAIATHLPEFEGRSSLSSWV